MDETRGRPASMWEALAVPLALGSLLLASQLTADLLVAALVLVALVATALGGPRAAVALTGAALPLPFISVGIRTTEWSVLELAILSTGLAVGVELIRRIRCDGMHATVRQLLIPADVTLVALALAAIGCVSLLWVADERFRADSARELRRVVLEPLVIAAAVRLMRRPSSGKAISMWISASAAAVAVLALAQIVFRTSGVEIGAVFRPIGTYPHPNNLALYLERVAWVPLALGARLPHLKVPSWTLTALIAVAAAATLSRGALIALVVGGLVLMLLRRRRPPARLLVGAGIATVMVGLLARYGAESGESLSSRWLIWESSAAMIRDHPLTGVGLDQFFNQYGVRYVQPAGWAERYTSHPHNAILDFWVRLGLLGLGVLTGLLWLTVTRLWRGRRSRGMLLPATLLAGLVGGWAHGLIDNSFFLQDLAVFFWLAIALSDRELYEEPQPA